MVGSWVEQVARELESAGVDLGSLGLAWVRVATVVAIVPAFGLRALPGPVRVAMGLVLAVSVAPAIDAPTSTSMPWVWQVGLALLGTLPIAVAAAIPLWAAMMAGGIVDAVRGFDRASPFPTAGGGTTPFGVAFALLSSWVFLASGGPAQVAQALSYPQKAEASVALRVGEDLANGVQMAVAIAAPVLVAAVVVEVASALVARSASPSHVQVVLASLRSIALLAIVALTFGHMAEAMALLVESSHR